jgi:hypothetical protein
MGLNFHNVTKKMVAAKATNFKASRAFCDSGLVSVDMA